MIYQLYTDGACQPNPGQGGWAFIVYPESFKDRKHSKSGFCLDTTNNRMELTAVIEGLKYTIMGSHFQVESLPENHLIKIYTDSVYVVKGTNTWMHSWNDNDWKKKDGKSVLNSDLWKEIYNFKQKIKIESYHVQGHAGHPENEECDKLAVEQIKLNQK